MSTTDTLTALLTRTHAELVASLDRADAGRRIADARDPHPERAAVDTFLAHASRHVAAMLTVVVPAVHDRLADGPALAASLVDAYRRLEVALHHANGREYGSLYDATSSRAEVWADAREALAAACESEQALGERLELAPHADDPDWARLLERAAAASPTRPHPWIPHQGTPGRAARGVARRVDQFWDTAQSRMVPGPPDHRDRDAEGWLTSWLLADPHLPEDADGAEETPPAGS